MMNNHQVLDSKIRNKVHNASYPTHYSKMKEKQHNVNFMGFIDPKCYLLCTTEALTLQFAFQKQAELIVCLSTLQSTITMPTEVTEAWMFLSGTERLFHTVK